jgi:hypothetical protein
MCTGLPAVYLLAQDKIFPFSSGGKIGYKDAEGSILIEPQFEYAEEFVPGFPWTVVGTGYYELLNFNMDQREVNFYGKFGLISEEGKIIFEPVFSIILKLGKETAVVGNGNGYLYFESFPGEKNFVFDGDIGVVGIRGDTLVPVRYQSLEELSAGDDIYWFVMDEDSSFLIGRDSKFFIRGEIESIHDFHNGLARVKTPSGYGYLDTVGRMSIIPQFEKASDFNNGIALVKNNYRYFHIDVEGRPVEAGKIEFDEISPFSEGLARVRIFDEFGYIYPDTTFFILPEFSEAGSFFNDIAPVSTIDSFGYVQADGSRDLTGRYGKNPVNVSELLDSMPEALDTAGTIPCGCSDSAFFDIFIDTLDLTHYIALHLEALRWGPYIYYRYPQMLEKVSAGEGTLAGRSDFNFDFIKPGNEVWEEFRKAILFPLIRNSRLYPKLWDWINPFLKQVFFSMPEKHREIYRQMIDYLIHYFNDYPAGAVQQFLIDFPEEFAYRHWDGSRSPFRKVSALFERLIFIHKVLKLEDLQNWILKADAEIRIWEQGS